MKDKKQIRDRIDSSYKQIEEIKTLLFKPNVNEKQIKLYTYLIQSKEDLIFVLEWVLK